MIEKIFDFFLKLIFGNDPNNTIKTIATTVMGIMGWIALFVSGGFWIYKAFVDPKSTGGWKVHRYLLLAIFGLIMGNYFINLASGYANDLGSQF